MPTDVTWLVESRVVHVRNSNKVTLQDMAQSDVDITQHLEDSDAVLVHLLLDNRDVDAWAIDVQNLRKVSQALPQHLKHPRLGWIVVFGIPRGEQLMANFVGNVVTQKNRVRFHMVDSAEEAVKFLQDIDVTLPELPSLD